MTAGRVVAICTSEEKRVPKKQVQSALLEAGRGIQGDAHAGDWHRQVSFLSLDDVEGMRVEVPGIEFGAFAENFVIEGVDLERLGLGTLLRIGPFVLTRVSQIGKVCHDPCAIFQKTGDCIMPRAGLFARVIEGGRVSTGDSVEIVNEVPRDTFQAVVLTISTLGSKGQREDTAGPAVQRMLEEKLGAHVYALEVLPDARGRITERLAHYSDGHSIDLVLTVGGTGLSPDDLTPEATRQIIEREVPGLAEAMRAYSMKKTPHAALSRGVAGIRGQTLILNLPGSLKGAVENLEAVLPTLPHALEKLRGDTTPCAGDG
ncbi:MAG: MOSC domain-containing protein [Candidatus Eiseniibacteriota bacterium]|nr:MAG: MOSC domain-containing protein [Candidatus Eisenbacteria bacterium]